MSCLHGYIWPALPWSRSAISSESELTSGPQSANVILTRYGLVTPYDVMYLLKANIVSDKLKQLHRPDCHAVGNMELHMDKMFSQVALKRTEFLDISHILCGANYVKGRATRIQCPACPPGAKLPKAYLRYVSGNGLSPEAWVCFSGTVLLTTSHHLLRQWFGAEHQVTNHGLMISQFTNAYVDLKFFIYHWDSCFH